jgi:hypothetical protein
MTVLYSFVDTRGVNHDIRERDIQEAYRQLLSAGYSMHEAHDKSLDFLLAKITLRSIPETDLLYGAHNHHEEMRVCSEVAHKLMIKTQQQKKETNNETQTT